MTLTMEYSSSCSVSKVLLKLELDKAPEFKAAPFEQKSYLSLPHPNNSLPQVCVCVCSCSNQDDDFVCGQQGATEVLRIMTMEHPSSCSVLMKWNSTRPQNSKHQYLNKKVLVMASSQQFPSTGVCSCVPARLFGG